MKTLFNTDELLGVNYLASIRKIDNLSPIPNADKLVKTTVGGYDMIVSKDTKVGDLVVYFPLECSICQKFLSANNLYSKDEFEMNSNSEEVKKLIIKFQNETNPDEKEKILNEIKQMGGFFNKYGRVRIMKLRGEYSQGFITPVENLVKAFPELRGIDFESLVGSTFNKVGKEVLCQKYVPMVKERPQISQSHWKKRMKKLRKFDRLIPGTFMFHYDTVKINDRMSDFDPNDKVTLTTKGHGSSMVIANIPTRRQLSTWEKFKKFIHYPVNDIIYDVIYSSRNIIKNKSISLDGSEGFYDQDIWADVKKVIAEYIPKDWTIYGEILGYVTGTNKFIQKNHDYGCKVGQWKFMPYRISRVDRDGVEDMIVEENVEDVIKWTNSLIKEHPELSECIIPMELLYHGYFKDLYPNIPVDENWRDKVLEMMKTDSKKDDLGHRGFFMEMKEPMCMNKVPREGIVFRKDDDKHLRAWKLKTAAHYNIEAMQHDAGEVDMEEEA